MKKISDIDWVQIKSGGKTPSPSNWEDEILYFLLVDRFADGNESTALFEAVDNGNAVSTLEDAAHWSQAGGSWVGGNIKGLKSKIPYLKGLGITTIWVSPILKQVSFENSYHGYGIQDYLSVDPHFGSNEDFKEFVDAAHAEGLYVILDIIINHSGNVFGYQQPPYGDNPPFWNGQTFPVAGFKNAAGSTSIAFLAQNTAGPNDAIWPQDLQAPETFTQKGKIRNWEWFPEYLEGDFETLKDIHLGTGDLDNFTASPALIHLCDAYKYWIAYADLDGFRVDTVKHMDPGATRYFVSVFHEFATEIGKDNFYLIGEVTGGRARAVDTIDATGLDAALGIDDIQGALENTIKGWGQPSDYFNLFRNSALVGKDSHTWFNGKVVTMIDDHDKVGRPRRRFSANGYSNLIFNAMALNICTIGIPCIYYGTEQAFDGQGDSDQYIREAMFGGEFGAFRSRHRHFFNSTQENYESFCKLAAFRKNSIVLRRGRQYLREISGDGLSFGYPVIFGSGPIRSVIAWSRILDQDELLVAFSNDLQNNLSVWVTIDNDLNNTGDIYRCLYSNAGTLPDIQFVAANGKAVRLTVPKGAFVIYGK